MSFYHKRNSTPNPSSKQSLIGDQPGKDVQCQHVAFVIDVSSDIEVDISIAAGTSKEINQEIINQESLIYPTIFVPDHERERYRDYDRFEAPSPTW